MKKRYLWIVLGIIVTQLSSCSDFLDTVPTDRISDKVVWKDSKTVTLYVNSFYRYIHDWGNFGSQQSSGNLTEGLTETLKYGAYVTGDRYGSANILAFQPERFDPNGSFLGAWGAAYTGIRRVNEFLVSLEKYSELSPEDNLLFEGQARFFRAFLYFQLAKRHGGVILYTDMNLIKDKNRSSDSDTWDLIASDLDFAASALPKSWENKNKERVTKGAAFALKSRAMLYAERWKLAKDAADSVFKLNKYQLMDDYADSWKGGNSESILEYNYLATAGGPNHDFDKYYAPFGEMPNLGGAATPTQDMVESYENKLGHKVNWSPWHVDKGTSTRPPYDELEPRFHATVIYNGSIWKGKTMENSVDGTNGRYMDYTEHPRSEGRTTTGYYLRKLLDESNLTLDTRNSTQTWVELRLAEVYLNRAEAAYQLGEISTAIDDINIIRQRPGVSLPSKQGLVGETLMEAIRQERKIELAYEGHLYWDMRRWKLAHIDYNNFRTHGLRISKSGTGYIYEYVDCDLQDRKFLQKTYVLPIPNTEFLNNSAIEQYDEWK